MAGVLLTSAYMRLLMPSCSEGMRVALPRLWAYTWSTDGPTFTSGLSPMTHVSMPATPSPCEPNTTEASLF